MKRINIFLAAGLMMAALSFTSCEKEVEETSPFADLMETDDEVAAFYDDIESEADEISFTDTNVKAGVIVQTGFSGSRTVTTTYSGDTTIHTITFENFVNENSQSERVKNGTIVVKVLGRPILPAFWRQTTFTNFTINDNLIEGVKEIEKTGDYQFTLTLTNGKVTFADDSVCTREFNRTRTWLTGYATPNYIWDDEFSVEGEAWGVNRKGNEYAHTVTNPLLIRRNCRWIVQGTVQMVVSNQTAVLDYGTGECDRFATLMVNGETFTIRLRGGQQ